MKRILPLAAVCLLAGCQTFFIGSGMDSTNNTSVPYIQRIQKADTVGHTDPEQRKMDIYACGVGPSADLNDKRWQPANGYPNLSVKDRAGKRDKLEHCMEGKGYIVFGFEECGSQKDPTGLCN
ncbi:hypothetical protein DBV23_12170 [Edwardsiella ictaluri]|uniref:Lipoprotein n=2 Tax=Edwardsiella ictaluri TaxID=67780 RepID=C5BAJ4_EDWI9|nr:hypothetical protein [Edwardsiella ictaluri]ACR70201.1 hypothetical protein NT01EI_3049 [Edwardsiella ictaluri 93-146]ARD39179.1 hypothetical protein B6E78_07095 [Edwardsiella ictaluri]AVZ82914.1 hypothetical protein DBV23_12170 [Edwardsiella ictaluri]EKS7764799.1 hypothetical protein [Edwardsiella ictaluri]EKS7771700.1 hypothetical protein [Edwardsiella ictaluri]